MCVAGLSSMYYEDNIWKQALRLPDKAIIVGIYLASYTGQCLCLLFIFRDLSHQVTDKEQKIIFFSLPQSQDLPLVQEGQFLLIPLSQANLDFLFLPEQNIESKFN